MGVLIVLRVNPNLLILNSARITEYRRIITITVLLVLTYGKKEH